MDFILIYFSGTGNTELISRQIGKNLAQKGHHVNVLSLEDEDSIQQVNFEGKVIGFGFPVYKFTYPDKFRSFFNLLNEKAEDNPCFLYSTYARFTADSFHDFNQNLDPRKFQLIAAHGFKAPSNGISARLSEDHFEYRTVMFFEDEIIKKIDIFCEDILQKLSRRGTVPLHLPHDRIGPLRLRIVRDIERTKYPLLQIDADRCSQCGLCVRQCPDKNLKKKTDRIQIKDAAGCLHCLRCMHHCPKNAISFGKLSQGENQYTLKKRDAFFEKSGNGYKEPYWADFEPIRKKWRRNTLKYWWKHRRHPEI